MLVEHCSNEVTLRFSVDGMNLEESLENAKRIIRKDFLFVGLVELFDESLILLSQLLGIGLPLYYAKNRAANRAYGDLFSDEQHEFVVEKNRYDLELYKYAEKLFRQRLEHEGETFVAKVAEFKQINDLVWRIVREEIDSNSKTLLGPETHGGLRSSVMMRVLLKRTGENTLERLGLR